MLGSLLNFHFLSNIMKRNLPTSIPALSLLFICLFGTQAAFSADTQRQAEVAQRGAEVMPFDLKATTHFFSKTANGGIQRVVAKDPSDTAQIGMVRAHLHDIHSRFLHGDFSGPSQIHGDDMPGLAQLKSAKPGEISIAYADVKEGAELTFRTANPKLVEALHAWIDAQLSDHGADAMEGHQHEHMHNP
jgi:hypothetical protein